MACLLCARAADASSEYLSRPDVRSFMDVMQAEHGLELVELERVLGEARHQPSVVRLVGPDRSQSPRAVPSYPAYRARFLKRSRIVAGVQYWQTHEAQLQRAELEFGVPAEVILGILGVETAYGQNTGSFRIVDALATIAFDGPRRQEYFRDELKEFLLLAREMAIDPLALKGSYAGAMGFAAVHALELSAIRRGLRWRRSCRSRRQRRRCDWQHRQLSARLWMGQGSAADRSGAAAGR
jgi:membrane-bound lytic murein transglycosylase B